MPENVDVHPATPDSGVPSSGSTPASTPAPSTPAAPQATPAEPYLKVNDRTSYLTRDDAVKGYTELQNRLTSLSTWEKLYDAPDKGGFGFPKMTPEQVAQYLDELIELRNKVGSQAAPAGATPQATPTGVEQLSPEWQNYIKTLQEKGGFVTRDTLAKIEERLNQVDQHTAAEQQQREISAANHGTALLAEEIKAVGLPENPELLKKIGGIIGSNMNADSYDARGNLIPGSTIDRFVRGDESVRRAIIKEHFQTFQEFGDTFAKSKNADYAAQKTSAMSNTPRPIPASSPTPVTPKNPGKMSTTEVNREAQAFMENLKAQLSSR